LFCTSAITSEPISENGDGVLEGFSGVVLAMKHWKIRAVAIPIAAVLCIASIRWQQTSALATILLLYATFEYVMANQENVGLLRKQLERQEKIFVRFGLRSEREAVYIWAANLGLSSFLISYVRVRIPNEPKPVVHKLNWIVPTGTLKNEIPFPPETYNTFPATFGVALDISLIYEGIGEEHQTEWRAFTIDCNLSRRPIVYAGIQDTWQITCPKCGLGDMQFMDTEGIRNLDEGWGRQKEMEQEFANSCPEHKSRHLLTYNPNNPVKKLVSED
jgi:hypothetical protein